MINKLFIICSLPISLAQAGEQDDWFSEINLDEVLGSGQFSLQEIGNDINGTYPHPQADSGMDIYYTAAPAPTQPPITGSSFEESEASTSIAPAPLTTPVPLDPFGRSQSSFIAYEDRPETAIYSDDNDLISTKLYKEDDNTYLLFNKLQISSEIDPIFINGACLKVEDCFVQSLIDSINEGTRDVLNLFSIHPNAENIIQLNKLQTLVRFFFIIDHIHSKLDRKKTRYPNDNNTLSNIFLYVADSFNSWPPQHIGFFLMDVESRLLAQARIIEERIINSGKIFSQKMAIKNPSAYSSFCISIANKLLKLLQKAKPAVYQKIMKSRPSSKLTAKILGEFVIKHSRTNNTSSQQESASAPAPLSTPVFLNPSDRSQSSFFASEGLTETAIYSADNDLISTKLYKEDDNTYLLFNKLQISSEIDPIFINGACLKVEDCFVQSLIDSINEGTRDVLNLFSIHPNAENIIQLNKLQTLVRFFFIIDHIHSKLDRKKTRYPNDNNTLSNIFLYVADSFNSWPPQHIGFFLMDVESRLLAQARIIEERIINSGKTFSQKMAIKNPSAYSSFCISIANKLLKLLQKAKPAVYQKIMKSRPSSKLTAKILGEFIFSHNLTDNTSPQQVSASAPAPLTTPVPLDPSDRNQSSFIVSEGLTETAVYSDDNDLISTKLYKEDDNTYLLFNKLQISSEIDNIFINGACLKVEDCFIESLTDSINEGTRDVLNLFSIHPNAENIIQLNELETLVRFFFIIDHIHSKLDRNKLSRPITTLSNIFLYVADSFSSWNPEQIGLFLTNVGSKLLAHAQFIKGFITNTGKTFSQKMAIKNPSAYSSFCISIANKLLKVLQTSHPAAYQKIMENRPSSELTVQILGQFISGHNWTNNTSSQQVSASTCTSPTAADPRTIPAMQLDLISGAAVQNEIQPRSNNYFLSNNQSIRNFNMEKGAAFVVSTPLENILGKRSLPNVETPSISEPSLKRPCTESDHNISLGNIEDLRRGILASIDVSEKGYARTGQFIKRSQQFKDYYLQLTDPLVIKKISQCYDNAAEHGIQDSFFLFIFQDTFNVGATKPGESPLALNWEYISYIDHLEQRKLVRSLLKYLLINSPHAPEAFKQCFKKIPEMRDALENIDGDYSNRIARTRDLLESIDRNIEECVIRRGYPFSL